ncbi:Uncharacterised protein [Pseudomonas aeruginosa]|nr:Uncharacterised protein [Pseudomonas aeruginosa]
MTRPTVAHASRIERPYGRLPAGKNGSRSIGVSRPRGTSSGRPATAARAMQASPSWTQKLPGTRLSRNSRNRLVSAAPRPKPSEVLAVTQLAEVRESPPAISSLM